MGSILKDSRGRPVLDCTTLLPHLRRDTDNFREYVQPAEKDGELDVMMWYNEVQKRGIHMGEPPKVKVEDSEDEDMHSSTSSESVGENHDVEHVMVMSLGADSEGGGGAPPCSAFGGGDRGGGT